MAKKTEFRNVLVVDNGLRCFVPPCYMYNLVDSDGNVAITVSHIEIDSSLGKDEKDIIYSGHENGILSSGVVSEYVEHLGGEDKIGRKFAITQIR